MSLLRRLFLFTVVTAIALLASGFAAASPPGWTDYVVKKGDTCASIALAFYGDGTRYDLIHEANPGLGPSPHNLKEGSVLHLPPRPPAAPAAKLGAVRNVVDVNENRGHTNDPLFRGNRVATHATAAADIEFRDATELELGEDTLVVIFGGSAASASRTRTAADAKLVTGRLRAHLAQLAGDATTPSHEIETPSAVTSLGAGEAQVHVDETKATRLAVYRGRSTISAQHKVVKVNEGFGSKAVAGKAPTPPRPLPPAPVWSTPFPTVVLVSGKGLADVAGTYAPGTGPGDAAAGWHVELARDAAFKDVLVDTRIARSVVRLEQRQLPVGTYFARVSAIDGDKFEGQYGPVARIQVAEVEITPLPDHHARIDLTPRGLACATGDAPLATVVEPLYVDHTDAVHFRCAPALNTTATGTIELPADRLGPLTVQARWASALPATANSGDVTLDVLDAAMAPIRKRDVVVTATVPGVEVVSIRPAATRGEWIAHVAWNARINAFSLHVKASDLDEADSTALTIVRVEPVHHWEASVGAGIAATDTSLARDAARAELGAAFHHPAGPGSIAVGLALAFEYAPSAETGPTSVRTSTLAVGIPFAYRLGRGNPWIAPYVAVIPELLEQSLVSTTTTTSSETQRTLLGVEGAVGGRLRLGAGALYLQAGYRGAGALQHDASGVPTQALVVSLGYAADL